MENCSVPVDCSWQEYLAPEGKNGPIITVLPAALCDSSYGRISIKRNGTTGDTHRYRIGSHIG